MNVTGSNVATFAAASGATIVDAIRTGRPRADGGPVRAAIVNPTPERVARAAAIAERGRPWRGREGIWFSPQGLLSEGGTLAVLFPGVDAAFDPRVEDVARHFGLPAPSSGAKDMQELVVAIIGVNRLFDHALARLGLRPKDVAGHSIGEWSGMVAMGVVPDDVVDPFIATLLPGSVDLPGVLFASAGAGADRVRPAIEGLDQIALSHDNCPHQVLICGIESSIDQALGRLQRDGIVCQKLPFRSGFHSPLFASYLGAYREKLAHLPLTSPRPTLWSATTCAPYPQAPDAIRALTLEHLVRPVRFRELIEVLHAQGTRVFVQAGVGSLVHFVEDTLRGRPHVAIAANTRERSGMEQLAFVAAALFVEGAAIDFAQLGSSAPAPSRKAERIEVEMPDGDEPLLAEFTASMDAVAAAQREIVDMFIARRERPPGPTTTTRRLSLETLPELTDHAFIRQPEGWPTVSDRQPVVPMTTLLHLMLEHAQEFFPGQVAIEIGNVRAHRWLIVAPPVDVRISCRRDDQPGDRVRVVIDDYCEATVTFARAYPTAPAADREGLTGPSRTPLSARALYDERWLFHGPAFQGLVDVQWLGEAGVSGTLVTPAAPGALLDNAGQLFGYWVMEHSEVDRMAMPIRLGSVRFHGPHPRTGDRLHCTVRVRSFDHKSVVGDLTLAHDGDGAVWATIEGWENHRFETDVPFMDILRWPEKNLLASWLAEGLVVFDDHYRAATTRDRLARRFLGERERAEYERQTPRQQRTWLAGRIAAKDAVRDLLWKQGLGPLFPVEVEIENEASGRPIARTATGHDVRISIAHKQGIAAAVARIGVPVGVDVEHIERRSDAFADLAFTREELRVVAGEPADEAWTRLWSAKEAAAKAAGTGLGGAPGRFPIRDRAGERLLVGDTWVSTRRRHDFILAWTNP